MQCFHGVENHFVMHRSAEQRVWMANESDVRRISFANIEQRLEASGRAVEK